MKKYLIIPAKVVILISLIATAFTYSTGIAIITFFLNMLISPNFLYGDKISYRYFHPRAGAVASYYWSSDEKRKKWYSAVYVANIVLFLTVSLYGPISKNITQEQYKNSIARYMQYTESNEYKQKQEVFKQQFIAMQERAKGK